MNPSPPLNIAVSMGEKGVGSKSTPSPNCDMTVFPCDQDYPSYQKGCSKADQGVKKESIEHIISFGLCNNEKSCSPEIFFASDCFFSEEEFDLSRKSRMALIDSHGNLFPIGILHHKYDPQELRREPLYAEYAYLFLAFWFFCLSGGCQIFWSSGFCLKWSVRLPKNPRPNWAKIF